MAKAAEKSGKASAKNSKAKVAPKSGGVEAKTGVKPKKTLPKPQFNLQAYIYRVLKQVHPEIGISSSTMGCLNSIAFEVYRKLARTAQELSHHAKSKTLSAQDVQSAVKLHVPGELQKHAVSEATKALAKYQRTISA